MAANLRIPALGKAKHIFEGWHDEAPDADSVREAQREAGLAFTRIWAAIPTE